MNRKKRFTRIDPITRSVTVSKKMGDFYLTREVDSLEILRHETNRKVATLSLKKVKEFIK